MNVHKFVLFLSTLAIFASQVDAGQKSMAESMRTAYLALELVDMRCPSQYLTSVLAELPIIQRGNIGNRILHGGRKLLGKRRFVPPPHETTLKEFREITRAQAVEKAHGYCTGAPDDRGPAVFFPLHLDVDADNGGYGEAKDAAGVPMPVPAAAVPAALPDPVGAGTATPAVADPGMGAAGLATSEAPVEDMQVETKQDDDDGPTEEMQNGPSMVVVMVLLVIVGVGVGVVGFKFVNKQTSSTGGGEAPVAERASNLKKQLGKMKAVLANQG